MTGSLIVENMSSAGFEKFKSWKMSINGIFLLEKSNLQIDQNTPPRTFFEMIPVVGFQVLKKVVEILI